VNMKAVTSLQYCFRSEIHEQAMKCWQVHYHSAKAMNYFFTNLSVFFYFFDCVIASHKQL